MVFQNFDIKNKKTLILYVIFEFYNWMKFGVTRIEEARSIRHGLQERLFVLSKWLYTFTYECTHCSFSLWLLLMLPITFFFIYFSYNHNFIEVVH